MNPLYKFLISDLTGGAWRTCQTLKGNTAPTPGHARGRSSDLLDPCMAVAYRWRAHEKTSLFNGHFPPTLSPPLTRMLVNKMLSRVLLRQGLVYDSHGVEYPVILLCRTYGSADTVDSLADGLMQRGLLVALPEAYENNTLTTRLEASQEPFARCKWVTAAPYRVLPAKTTFLDNALRLVHKEGEESIRIAGEVRLLNPPPGFEAGGFPYRFRPTLLAPQFKGPNVTVCCAQCGRVHRTRTMAVVPGTRDGYLCRACKKKETANASA